MLCQNETTNKFNQNKKLIKMKKVFMLVAVATLSFGAISCETKPEETVVETNVEETAEVIDSATTEAVEAIDSAATDAAATVEAAGEEAAATVEGATEEVAN